MAAQVLSFFQRSPRYAPAPADWSQQELAEFYRVEGALIKAGIRVGTDRGLSDENEPWFVFYRTDDGEVVIHFARIDGEYLIAGPAYEEIARGFDFSSLVRNLVARHPLIRRSQSGDNVSIHPAALLVAVVGTAFFKTGEARAAETGASNAPASSRPVLLSSSANTSPAKSGAPASVAAAASSSYDTVQLPANQAVLVLAAALLASDFRADAGSLDSAAHGALASAAAELDFSGPAALGVASGNGAIQLNESHASAIANTPVQTVSSVLSLVALLSTLPHSAELTAAPGVALTMAAPAHANMDATPLAIPDLHTAATWSLEVRLGAGALPNIEAVQLVRALVGDNAAQKISVIEVAKLPDVLAEIISRGDRYQTTPVPAQSNETSAGGETQPTPVSESQETPGGQQTNTPPASGNETTSTHVGLASLDLVKQFIDYFVAHTDHVSMMMQGSQVVMFDDRVLSDPGAIDHMTSMTFDFVDGSSINLVGDQHSFLHGGILL
uniref:hypothetical protein n=1 Tax=uncultured Caulobacter sp. TaxID=158749 RepID=UPI0025E890A8|nr:hypothetical protein [uncultured Caulobacter sp.]